MTAFSLVMLGKLVFLVVFVSFVVVAIVASLRLNPAYSLSFLFFFFFFPFTSSNEY